MTSYVQISLHRPGNVFSTVLTWPLYLLGPVINELYFLDYRGFGTGCLIHTLTTSSWISSYYTTPVSYGYGVVLFKSGGTPIAMLTSLGSRYNGFPDWSASSSLFLTGGVSLTNPAGTEKFSFFTEGTPRFAIDVYGNLICGTIANAHTISPGTGWSWNT